VRPVFTELRSRFNVSIDFGAFCCKLRRGRDLARAVCRRLHIATARDRSQANLCGIRGGQSVSGAGYL
jgi:hypothetical protein